MNTDPSISTATEVDRDAEPLTHLARLGTDEAQAGEGDEKAPLAEIPRCDAAKQAEVAGEAKPKTNRKLFETAADSASLAKSPAVSEAESKSFSQSSPPELVTEDAQGLSDPAPDEESKDAQSTATDELLADQEAVVPEQLALAIARYDVDVGESSDKELDDDPLPLPANGMAKHQVVLKRNLKARLSCWVAEEEKGVAAQGDRALPGSVVAIPGVQLFAFPEGIYLSTKRHAQSCHSFVLTDLHGGRLYGFCCILYHRLDSEKLDSVREEILEAAVGNIRAKLSPKGKNGCRLPPDIYNPTAICIFSRFAFHNSFMRFLDHFCLKNYKAFIGDSCLGILHSAFTNLNSYSPRTEGPYGCWGFGSCQTTILAQSRCSGDCLVDAGPTIVTVPGAEADSDLELHFPPLLQSRASIPICDADFRMTFRLLSAESVAEVASAILRETSVLFVTKHYQNLAAVLETLMALLYPLKWPFSYIPVLPTSLLDYLQVPQPYIIGSLPCAKDQCPSHTMIVDLDCNRVQMPTSHKAPAGYKLPDVILRQITIAMECFGDAVGLPRYPFVRNVDQFQKLRVKKKQLLQANPDRNLSLATAGMLKGLHFDGSGVSLLPSHLMSQAKSSESQSLTMKLTLARRTSSGSASSPSSIPSPSSSSSSSAFTSFPPPSPQASPPSTPTRLRKSLSSPSNSLSSPSDQRTCLNHLVLQLRTSFLDGFIGLLKGYRHFMRTVPADRVKHMQPGELFKYKLFLQDPTNVPHQAFLVRFCKSNIFSLFAQERALTQSFDWFDCRVLAVLRAGVQSLKRRSSEDQKGTLLNHESSMFSTTWYVCNFTLHGNCLSYVRAIQPKGTVSRPAVTRLNCIMLPEGTTRLSVPPPAKSDPSPFGLEVTVPEVNSASMIKSHVFFFKNATTRQRLTRAIMARTSRTVCAILDRFIASQFLGLSSSEPKAQADTSRMWPSVCNSPNVMLISQMEKMTRKKSRERKLSGDFKTPLGRRRRSSDRSSNPA